MKKTRNRKVNKGSILNVRIADRLRYGAELVARRRGESLTNVVARAMSLLLETEGFDERRTGEPQTLLDRLWTSDGAERLLRLHDLAPDLLTEEERDAFIETDAYIKDTGSALSRHEYAQRVVNHLNDIGSQVESVNKILNEESPD